VTRLPRPRDQVRVRSSVRWIGGNVSDAVLVQLGIARAVGVRSVWCGGLWVFDVGDAFAWRLVPT
jgi:hypothetical protein